jgi:hypothetical protein
MKLKHIKFKDLQGINWSGGVTKQYFIYPENAEYENKDFLFRLSTATIEKTVKFTNFIGYKRFLCMYDNNLELKINSQLIEKKSLEIVKFNSEDDVYSNSLGQDFNLMVANDINQADLFIDHGFINLEDDYIMLIALDNHQIFINDIEYILNRFDSLIIENFMRKNIDIISSNKILLASIKFAYQIKN